MYYILFCLKSRRKIDNDCDDVTNADMKERYARAA